MPYVSRCPYCKSADITPGKVTWHCNACGQDFAHAFVSEEEEAPGPAEKPK